MEKRRLGRTAHNSSVAIFGAAAFYSTPQVEADDAMEKVLQAGVNHIDVAPSYGKAEVCLSPWMQRERRRFFLGCKTQERTKDGAAAELRRSLDRLKVTNFDLYQLHAVNTFEEMEQVCGNNGALQALIKAKEMDLIRHIGITAHGFNAPKILSEAIRRFDFDTVLFPLNFIQYSIKTYRQNSESLIQQCSHRDIGVMAIKSITRAPWINQEKKYTTWYQPFDDPENIQKCINFVLSQEVTGICTVGDTHLLPIVLKACESFTRLNPTEQSALIETAAVYQPLFPEDPK